jgi:hypothetical protein
MAKGSDSKYKSLELPPFGDAVRIRRIATHNQFGEPKF